MHLTLLTGVAAVMACVATCVAAAALEAELTFYPLSEECDGPLKKDVLLPLKTCMFGNLAADCTADTGAAEATFTLYRCENESACADPSHDDACQPIWDCAENACCTFSLGVANHAQKSDQHAAAMWHALTQPQPSSRWTARQRAAFSPHVQVAHCPTGDRAVDRTAADLFQAALHRADF